MCRLSSDGGGFSVSSGAGHHDCDGAIACAGGVYGVSSAGSFAWRRAALLDWWDMYVSVQVPVAGTGGGRMLSVSSHSTKATLRVNHGAERLGGVCADEGDAAQVGEGNVSQDIEVPTETEAAEAEAVTL